MRFEHLLFDSNTLIIIIILIIIFMAPYWLLFYGTLLAALYRRQAEARTLAAAADGSRFRWPHARPWPPGDPQRLTFPPTPQGRGPCFHAPWRSPQRSAPRPSDGFPDAHPPDRLSEWEQAARPSTYYGLPIMAHYGRQLTQLPFTAHYGQ